MRFALFVALVFIPPVTAADPVPMYNGKDLTGWVNVNCAKDTFIAKNNEIITNGKPTGYLRTAKQYENFVMEFDWMHTREKGMANSGLFVWGDPIPAVGTGYTRGIEVQVLINYETDWATSHGDLFSIWGAKCKPDRPHPKGYERCLPSERRCKGANEWNHYKVIGNNGTIKLEVNGKEVSGVSQCNPRKGYLALESEGSECHFKNLMMTELPSTNPKPEECAEEDTGFKSMFDGLTLTGFEGKNWKASDGVLRPDGGAAASLVLSKPLPQGVLTFDWKLPGKGETEYTVVLADKKVDMKGKAGAWTRAKIVNTEAKAEMRWPALPGLEIRNLFFQHLEKK